MLLWRVLVFLLVLTAAASAATILNGSFESPYCSGICTLSSGLTDWVISKGSIDIVRSWSPPDGGQVIDLDGRAAGAISQNIATVNGGSYRVLFYLSINPDASGSRSLQVCADATCQPYTYNPALESGWLLKTFDFTASATTTNLKFDSLDSAGSWYGPALDNVIIQDQSVPEPSSLFLAGAALSALVLLRRR